MDMPQDILRCLRSTIFFNRKCFFSWTTKLKLFTQFKSRKETKKEGNRKRLINWIKSCCMHVVLFDTNLWFNWEFSFKHTLGCRVYGLMMVINVILSTQSIDTLTATCFVCVQIQFYVSVGWDSTDFYDWSLFGCLLGWVGDGTKQGKRVTKYFASFLKDGINVWLINRWVLDEGNRRALIFQSNAI